MSAPDVRRVAVVGAGTMGHGIAQVAAAAGHDVVLIDRADELVEAGLEHVRRNLQGGIERGKLDEAERDRTLERLSGSADLEGAVADADLVVEAVPERMDLKRRIFGRLDAVAPAHALLATNTSSLSVSALQDGLQTPGRVLGLHFFNPVHILKLVEVVRGERTDDDAVERGVGFCRRIDKEPIVVRDSPGFASSRLGIALGLEAMRMVEEDVASAQDIDKAMVLGYRHPMGPLRLTDLVGLDVRLDIARYLHQELGDDRFRPPDILVRMVDEGRLGRKAGRGFYDWEDGQ